MEERDLLQNKMPHVVLVSHLNLNNASGWLDDELRRRGVRLDLDASLAYNHVVVNSAWRGAIFLKAWEYRFKDPELAMLFKLMWGGK